jgi:hypothetical protein
VILDTVVMKSYNLYFEVPTELHELYKNRFGFDITDSNGKDRLGLPVAGDLCKRSGRNNTYQHMLKLIIKLRIGA